MYEYPHVRTRRARKKRMPMGEFERVAIVESPPTFVTLIEPSICDRIDAGTRDAFVTVHTQSLDEALNAAVAHRARGILLSPTLLGNEPLEAINQLIAKRPGLVTAAVVAEPDTRAASGLLGLGACGVQKVIDLTGRAGWDALRNLVDEGGGETGNRILNELAPLIQTANRETQQFFGMIVRKAPYLRTARALGQSLRITNSTLTSRFYRAGLPAPKVYLANTRLVYAAAFFESRSASIADVAHAMSYSSPQSFGRHVHQMCGITAGEFRRAHTFNIALENYKHTLVAPYESVFRSFRPFRGSAPCHSIQPA